MLILFAFSSTDFLAQEALIRSARELPTSNPLLFDPFRLVRIGFPSLNSPIGPSKVPFVVTMLAKTFLVAALGASVANAHMIMTQPVPYGKDTLTNSPLEAQGGDFPCKLRSGTYDITTENIMPIGSVQQLRFQGGATHGGGSCQISLTEDRAPTKLSTWKVIKSIEGGCPANADGNIGFDASAADPYHFNFTIPDGIATGKYTLAWT